MRRVAWPLLWLTAAFTLISGLQYLVQGMRFVNAAQDAEREEPHELYLR
jgi:phosphatidylglycerophosphate synthase